MGETGSVVGRICGKGGKESIYRSEISDRRRCISLVSCSCIVGLLSL